MAVKVVYDATRGLVQENDTTGAGGFEIKDAFISQGSEGTQQAPIEAAAAAANQDILARGVSLVKAVAAGGLDEVELQNGTAVGQQKIIVSHSTSNTDLVVKDESGNTVIASGVISAGDVALCIWTGTAWKLAANS
mgnify:CR=1 FL=1